MNCIHCNHKNPATTGYCQKCGQKLDFTADDIAGALVQRAKDERTRSTELNAKQTLTFAGVIFAIAFLLFLLAGGAPSSIHTVPAASSGASYTELDYRFDPPFRPELVPFTVKQP